MYIVFLILVLHNVAKKKKFFLIALEHTFCFQFTVKFVTDKFVIIKSNIIYSDLRNPILIIVTKIVK